MLDKDSIKEAHAKLVVSASYALAQYLQTIKDSEEIQSEADYLKSIEDCVNAFESAVQNSLYTAVLTVAITSLQDIQNDNISTPEEKEVKINSIVDSLKSFL